MGPPLHARFSHQPPPASTLRAARTTPRYPPPTYHPVCQSRAHSMLFAVSKVNPPAQPRSVMSVATFLLQAYDGRVAANLRWGSDQLTGVCTLTAHQLADISQLCHATTYV